jgi:mannose-6-phosphate isomerase-like protein (cupin superfamily)
MRHRLDWLFVERRPIFIDLSSVLRAGKRLRWISLPSYMKPPIVSIESTRSNWRSRGFSCDVWTDPPGQTWEDYTHAVDELVMVLEGEVEFEIGGNVIRPTVGEEICIPAGVLHSVRNMGKTTSRWLYGYKETTPV